MNAKINQLLFLIIVLYSTQLSAQSIYSEKIDFQLLKQPKVVIDESYRDFKVTITSPYNLTVAEVVKKAKADHEKAEADYATVVANSEKEFQQKIKDYNADVVQQKEKFSLESAEFKKLSLLERLTLTEQKKNPRLVVPSKPDYVKPAAPIYREPNLNDFTIVDNNVLASQVVLNGFTRGAGYVDIHLDIKAISFQDNAGQTFASQPTKLVIKVNGKESIHTTFFQDFAFLSSSPSNNINKINEEKRHLDKIIKVVNDYLNNMYGFQAETKAVKILNVKNKGKFDDLERADIYVKTNLKKLQPQSSDINTAAFIGMQKGIDIWTQTLTNIAYKDSKADFNAKIAGYIYFNLINLNLALDQKTQAEKYLNQLQENLIYIKLSYEEENELKRVEKEIYQSKK